jgi:hypothetical protein
MVTPTQITSTYPGLEAEFLPPFLIFFSKTKIGFEWTSWGKAGPWERLSN